MRFFGKVGYGESTEAVPGDGVWIPVITEVDYRGDVIRNRRRMDTADQINEDLRVSNSISIVADEYAVKHFFLIKYVVWEGARWVVNAVEVKPPRLILELGGVYNGPTP
jgi:hypothetical protein